MGYRPPLLILYAHIWELQREYIHGYAWLNVTISVLYMPADGGHPGGQRTADTPADGGRTDTPAPGGRRTGGHSGGRYNTNGHIIRARAMRYGEKGDMEGAPTWRQERYINAVGQKQRLCSCVRMFTWFYLGSRNIKFLRSSPGADLYFKSLKHDTGCCYC
jgi:hypothetical protein